MSQVRRIFTDDEDNMIRRNAAGEIAVTRLEKELRAHRNTLRLRAYELGVRLTIKAHRVNSTPRDNGSGHHTAKGADFSKSPLSVGGDPLLFKLLRFHGNRRYEEIDPRRRTSCTHSSTALSSA